MTSIYPSSTSSTTSSSTSSANLLRISGMASGIDTDSVVKSMVSNYQAKIDKANQAKQLLQWKQDGYRNIIQGIKGLQDYFDPLSSKYILSSNSLNINTATSDATSVVSATAASTAQAGTYQVTVNNMATQAKIPGSSLNTMVKVLPADVTKWSGANLTLDDGTTPPPNIALDTNITDTSGNGTALDEVVANINSKISATSLVGKVSATYVNDASGSYIKFISSSAIKLTATTAPTIPNPTPTAGDLVSALNVNSGISSSTKLSDLGISIGTVAAGKGINFTVNGIKVPLDVDNTTTVQNLMDAVKSATSGAVTMSMDDTTGSISFQSKNYGSTSSVTLADDANGTLSTLKVPKPLATLTATGTDANVTITAPGQAATTTTQSSNQFTINGMSYNLVKAGTANVTVAANTDNVVNNIKSFITDYNTIISTINTKLTEKKDSGYPPLTDAQKSSMSDSQITAWETKGKVGVLRNDDYLSSLMTQLRQTFSPVYNSYNSADTSTGKIALSFGKYGTNAIGIDTSTDYTDGGKLVINDESKLKSAVENNLEDFKKLFIGTSSAPALSTDQSYIGSKNYNEDGIFTRMNKILTNYVATPGLGKDGTYTLSGSMNIFVNKQYDYSMSGSSGHNTLPDQVYSKTLSVSKFQTQLSDAQTRYYAKFTALETAMNSLNAQQSQLTSMLG